MYSQWNDGKILDKAALVPSDALRNPGLFNEVRRRNPTLPQYHPKYLTKLLDFGKLRRVRAILNHLVRRIFTVGVLYTLLLSESLVFTKFFSIIVSPKIWSVVLL